MKKTIGLTIFLSCWVSLFSQHITGNAVTDRDFQIRKESAHDKTPYLFIENGNLTGDRLEAMKFLYAYMPLPDIAANSPEFFLRNVDSSLTTLEEMPWGKDIPQREFLHFVLPLRVNNEPLDSSRMVFYEELKERVKDLTMEEAILETNHWCHEKVSYRPSDGRTSNPLSTLSQAIGRCGEESTFTVAALRSIGIPARQVYTPRWAHTDDNHAWVEAYANGKWYFLGACEPEPVLDLGWFNEPSSRAILMNTNVIGKYDGEEEHLSSHDILSTINVTEKYTPVDTLKARVLNPDGNPLENIKVNFCIYNYSEFYPVATKISDANGEAFLVAGHGDMVVWATDGEKFGFTKGNSKNDEVAEVILDKDKNSEGVFDLYLIPSPSRPNIPFVSAEQRNLNNLRFAKEDSIRNAYIATFATEHSVNELAKRLGVDQSKLLKILTESRGNHKKISDYLINSEPALRPIVMDILLAVSEKDRRDISMEVLNDNVVNLIEYPDSAIRTDYILNPRIEREPLVAYKSFFREKFEEDSVNLFRENPAKLVEWVDNNILTGNQWNPQGIKMDPVSVWEQRAATSSSRNIFFVALARSLGIPAQIDPVTLNTKFVNSEGVWCDAIFKDHKQSDVPKGRIKIEYEPQGRITDPLYYSQFSISRFINGVPVQLEYDDNDRVSSINARDKELDAGKYMMMSGQRMADGSVLARVSIFNIIPDSVLHVNLTIPQDSTQIQVIGSLNAENLYHDMDLDTDKSLLSTTGRGYYILGLIKSNHEPSKHVLNDMILAREALEGWEGEIMLLFPSEQEAGLFDVNEFKGLPSNMHFGIDAGNVIEAELKESLNIENLSYPLIVVADTFNRVVYLSSGYTIGAGERLLDVLDRLK